MTADVPARPAPMIDPPTVRIFVQRHPEQLPGYGTPQPYPGPYARFDAPLPGGMPAARSELRIEPRRRPRRWLWVVLAVLTLLAVIGAAAQQRHPAAPAPAGAGVPSSAAADVAEPTDTVRYEVTGTGKAGTVDYIADQDLSQQQDSPASLPWFAELHFANGLGSGAPLGVTAQRAGTGRGSITCRILVNGKVVSEHTSNGPAAVVSCSASGGS
jgi:hypothetical protein